MALTPLKAYPNFGTVIAIPPIPFPAQIPISATWTSDLMPAGFGGVSAGATSDHAATLELQRYADLAGLVPVGALLSQAMVAATPAWVGVNDGLPYLSFAVSIVNSAGAVANITAAAILTGPLP
jgi:hypothetical protein